MVGGRIVDKAIHIYFVLFKTNTCPHYIRLYIVPVLQFSCSSLLSLSSLDSYEVCNRWNWVNPCWEPKYSPPLSFTFPSTYPKIWLIKIPTKKSSSLPISSYYSLFVMRALWVACALFLFPFCFYVILFNFFGMKLQCILSLDMHTEHLSTRYIASFAFLGHEKGKFAGALGWRPEFKPPTLEPPESLIVITVVACIFPCIFSSDRMKSIDWSCLHNYHCVSWQ